MTAQKPSKAIQRIYSSTKAAYGEHWKAAVAELEPSILLIMKSEGHNDPMKAIEPIVIGMKQKKQDPSRLIAIACDMISKRTKKGWTL